MESTQDIRSLCELCKSLDCCPEHCCDWDTCQCSHCKQRKAAIQPVEQPGAMDVNNQTPSILLKATGQEEIKKIKKQKKVQYLEQPLQPEERPQEQIRISDGALIINYEIPDDEDKTVYAGGIKGIRALRQQRDFVNEQVSEDLKHELELHHRQHTGNQYRQYEESKN